MAAWRAAVCVDQILTLGLNRARASMSAFGRYAGSGANFEGYLTRYPSEGHVFGPIDAQDAGLAWNDVSSSHDGPSLVRRQRGR